MSFDFSAEMTDALVPFDKRCCWEKEKPRAHRDSLTYIKRDRQACKGVHWRRNSRKTPQTPPLPSMGLRTHTHKSISVALRRFTVNSSITLALFVYFQSTTAQSPSLLLLLLQLLYIYWESVDYDRYCFSLRAEVYSFRSAGPSSATRHTRNKDKRRTARHHFMRAGPNNREEEMLWLLLAYAYSL